MSLNWDVKDPKEKRNLQENTSEFLGPNILTC